MARLKLKTHADIAKREGVSTRTIAAWSEFEGWPGREPDGTFSARKINDFCKVRRLGRFNSSRNAEGKAGRDELREARRLLTIEQLQNKKIENERLRAEQQSELREIMRRDDVTEVFEKTKAAALAACDDVAAEVEQLLAAPPTAEDYPAMRAQLLGLVGSIGQRRMAKLSA